MKVKTLKIAVVGVGFIGKQHIEAIKRIPNTEVIAVVEADITRAKEVAELYAVPNYFADMEELFGLAELAVIHICTPNFLHYSMAKKAINAGINVFCEKPLSLTAKESSELAHLASEKGVATAVNLNYRSNAMVREMKNRIQKEMIGKPLLVVGQYIQDWLMFDTDYDWHFDPELVGPSRSVADIGSHLYDLIQFIMGEKVVRVFAELITVYPVRKKREQLGETFAQVYGDEVTEVEVTNEDAALIIAQLSSGVKVSMTVSQITGGFKNGLQVTVSGSKQSITWKQEQSDRLEIGKRDAGNEMLYADAKYIDPSLSHFIALPNGHAVGWADAFKNSINEFYRDLQNDIHNEDGSYVDFAAGHYLMKLVEATLLSNEEKRWVDVE
jgi:Predicted dehydrogenases and related proteins